ncbi:MAG: alanine--tRNA ligase [Nanoarchaeota archaeon]|nr:alanine--tRNA ligase [Nanoarchaeota archaeon]
MITRKELIKKYIEFFKSKDHKEIKNSSLIPENDPTVLFTTAGMHPLVPFLLGQPHPQGKRLVNVQRCIRTRDIEEVGDETHHTFFEQLGNWSLGDYWKKEAIEYTFKFITQILEISKEKLAASIFEGDKNSPKDKKSYEALLSTGLPKEKIAILNKKENWWGPAGKTGPCGPDSEIFYWRSKKPAPKKFDPKNKGWAELGNNVFMEFNQDKKKNLNNLKQKNVDFGGGVERFLIFLEKTDDAYMTNSFKSIIEKIEKLSNKEYTNYKKEMRIIADHIKTSCFIINDGIFPGNSEQGYVLRRLIRRAIRYAKELGIPKEKDIATPLIKEILKIYPDYNLNEKLILTELNKEKNKFQKTLDKGLKEFEKICKDKIMDGKKSFLLYQSYGFPIEMISELSKEKKVKFNPKDFEKELKKHQELSKTASAGKFKSGLADNSEQTTKLHTTSHLLLTALQKILNPNIIQKGSNINAERLRFDFNFDRKLTDEEKIKIENLVNEEIQKNQKITREEMSPKEAKKSGASGIFNDKYGNKVSVYTIGNFSKEICTGPHVSNTKELGKFKIIKEKSSSSGVRRIKAILN